MERIDIYMKYLLKTWPHFPEIFKNGFGIVFE